MKWWVIELHNYIMNDNSEAHNLGQILRLLHLAPVTFRPGLPTAEGIMHKRFHEPFLNTDYTTKYDPIFVM